MLYKVMHEARLSFDLAFFGAKKFRESWTAYSLDHWNLKSACSNTVNTFFVSIIKREIKFFVFVCFVPRKSGT